MSLHSWFGGADPCLDDPETLRFGPMCIGKYGGNVRAGAEKNEDGLLALRASDGSWEFAVIVDAHTSSESTELVLNILADQRSAIEAALNRGIAGAFERLRSLIESSFRSPSFLQRCKQISGECSCLIVCRMGRYVWWYSVGDCLLFALHPDLAAFDQTMLNQRNFYEWVGRNNTFDDEVPCYSTGTRRLRPGLTLLIMATDGFVEPRIPFLKMFEGWMNETGIEHSIESRMGEFLQRLHDRETRDSTTLIAWTATIV